MMIYTYIHTYMHACMHAYIHTYIYILYIMYIVTYIYIKIYDDDILMIYLWLMMVIGCYLLYEENLLACLRLPVWIVC